jgi:hypothetical protein
MPHSITLLFWLGLVLLLGAIVATILGYFFDSSWDRRNRLQLILWILIVMGSIVTFLAFELREKIDRLLFDGITATLALLAIGFAVWQFKDSQDLESKMTAFDKKMRSVADQMATRFAGNFPKNLTEINQVISKAEKTVDVMSDYVGYGHFSNSRQFNKYFRQLLDMPGRNIQVRMLIYARKEAEQMHETQFVSSDLKEPEKWAKLKEFCNRYENNLDSRLWEKISGCDRKIKDRNEKMKKGTQPTDQESAELDRELNSLRPEFDRLMFDRQLMYIKDLLQHGVEIRQTREKLPFFMWCEDGHEAVFTFLHEASKAEREVAFRTRDSRFVADSFEKKFEYLWSQKATRIELKSLEGHLEPDWLPESATQAKGPSLVPPKAG